MASTRTTVADRKRAEMEEACAQLRELFPIGSTVHTSLLHVSRSGMLRSVAVLVSRPDGSIENVSWQVARATGQKMHKTTDGVAMGGCGMDMGFSLVYSLGRALYPNGHPCIGRLVTDPAGYAECPSNDHSNESGDAYRTGFRPDRIHSDGGYALRRHWI